jgi:hypothetical protein
MANNASLIAADGQPLTAESLKMMDYVHARGQTLSAFEICERTRAAAAELEKVVASANERDIRRKPFPGKWHMADVVDHISQTQIRGAEELRHLLAGRRPPGPPVYEALKSGASEWAPWSTLMTGLHDANMEMIAIMESAAREEEKSGSAKVSGGHNEAAERRARRSTLVRRITLERICVAAAAASAGSPHANEKIDDGVCGERQRDSKLRVIRRAA